MPKPSMQMPASEFLAWREAAGLTRAQAAKLLSEELQRTYRPSRIGEWENGRVTVPHGVAVFVRLQKGGDDDGSGED